MTIQELKDSISKSDFSEVTKSKMMSVIEGESEVGNEVSFKIKTLMQEELNSDFNEAGVNISVDPEAQMVKKEYDDKLGEIESELKDDMDFGESELKDLEEMRKQVIKVDDDMKADKIRQSLVN